VSRQRAVILTLLVAGALVAFVATRWPSRTPTLRCPPGQVHLDVHGLARCGPGAPLPPGQALTVDQLVDLNRVTADELTLLPGMNEAVAGAIIEARDQLGGFQTWAEVDAVEGVGPARLAVLQRHCDFGAIDAGV
jgi:competence protein ComEA